MSWIDERLAEEKARADKNESIISSADTVFNDMWSYVLGDVEEAKKKGKPLFTNGTQLDRIVKLDVATFSPSHPKELHIALSKDKHSIVISGEVSMKFNLDICPDGAVCPKDEQGKTVTYKEAAQRILDPFLFPESQPQKSISIIKNPPFSG
jgi:hypothetical protein